MNFIFRVDASFEIGTGHVMRCLTLAEGLKLKGANCTFVCREHLGNLSELISQHGFKVVLLPNEISSGNTIIGDLEHSKWLGTNWETDAQQTQQSIQKQTIDWLIVDHYGIDYRWQSSLRPFCKKIMVIDDLTDRRHDCDLFLNQNYGSSHEKYITLLLDDCIQLHGSKYALLKSIYAVKREKLRVRNGKIERVLIYFGGGSDPNDLTGMTLRAFSCKELKSVFLDIVIGNGYLYKENLLEEASKRSRVKIHSNLPKLSDLMETADLAIGAGGATTWERCCLGLPSLVISVAENQKQSCKALDNDSFIEYIGTAENMSVEIIRKVVMELIKQPKRIKELGDKGLALVDGKGTERVQKALNSILQLNHLDLVTSN